MYGLKVALSLPRKLSLYVAINVALAMQTSSRVNIAWLQAGGVILFGSNPCYS